ncbi:polysaccharide deacetylase family protein [Candidatus Symbiothrix dinenymphae]|uniref:polysaccharide deacetylase family protein n=1 Tax=Candidatus Symbiothrix dinenymphae TaxID=467085 RepID=UPI0006C31795|nr:polysaccharide deacetylase family protein [Candidatus Symbiothrix dinenymphae]GAP72206.1 polysaccharide deacetylase [Candidatus Symbiothrix dinenymphae]
MCIEQPPFLYRILFPNAHWRFSSDDKAVYLTFDDGPIPEMTPWVLDLLDKYNIKAIFFCVADNVRKYPEIYRDILKRGHQTGNHTYHHLQGWKTSFKTYINDTEAAKQLIDSKLFRPPHGYLRPRQLRALAKQFKLIMWDVLTRDYSSLRSAQQVFEAVKRYTRNGSIIVFHDSLKSKGKIETALPQSIEWLLQQGYTFKLIPQ